MVLRLAALLRLLLLPLVVLCCCGLRLRSCQRGLMVRRRHCWFCGLLGRVLRPGCVRGLLARLLRLLLEVCFHGAGMTKGVPVLNSKAAVRANFQQHVLVAAKLYC